MRRPWGEVHSMGFAIHKGVGHSWGLVYNMGFVVYKGVRKGSNFERERSQNFYCSRNREGCLPNASMLQTMMHVRESPHLYQQGVKGIEMGTNRAVRSEWTSRNRHTRPFLARLPHAMCPEKILRRLWRQ